MYNAFTEGRVMALTCQGETRSPWAPLEKGGSTFEDIVAVTEDDSTVV